MKIRITETFWITPDGNVSFLFPRGQAFDVPDYMAQQWIKDGYCKQTFRSWGVHDVRELMRGAA